MPNKNIVIKKSKIHKKGVFAAKNFRKGEIVLKWSPKILEKPDVDKLDNDQKHYIWKAGKNRYFLMQSPEKFVNYACNPNTKVKNDCDIATKNIKKDEEITSNYGKGNLVSFKCKCGNKNCRGLIN